MLSRILIIGLLANGLMQPAQAAGVRELSQAELRRNVNAGQSVSLSQLLDFVDASIQGELIDVRAFDLDGVLYRVLIMTRAGKLASVIVDAKTGKVLSNNSARALEVSELANNSRGKKLGVGRGNSRGNSGNNGNKGGNSGGKSKDKGKK